MENGVNSMDTIAPVDVSNESFDIACDLSVSTRAHKPGPPERIFCAIAPAFRCLSMEMS